MLYWKKKETNYEFNHRTVTLHISPKWKHQVGSYIQKLMLYNEVVGLKYIVVVNGYITVNNNNMWASVICPKSAIIWSASYRCTRSQSWIEQVFGWLVLSSHYVKHGHYIWFWMNCTHAAAEKTQSNSPGEIHWKEVHRKCPIYSSSSNIW